MIINTELYKTFYVVAQEESISKAASVLYITQPAVSRSIKQLEDKTGCLLFSRTPKGVKLTKEGLILFQYIEQAFNFINLGEKKLDEAKNLRHGEVTIGVSDTICKQYLLPHLKDFNDRYPEIRIHVANHTTPIIIDMLKKGKIDLGIANLPVDDATLEIEEIMEVQDCFVVGKKYKNLASKKRSIKEILDYPIMLLERGSNSRVYLDDFLADRHIVIKPEIELGNFELLVKFATYNFGVACVIRNFVQEELESGQLYEVPLKENIPLRHIGMVYLKSVPLSVASSTFLRQTLEDSKNDQNII